MRRYLPERPAMLKPCKSIMTRLKITYEELLDYFWKHVDPTDAAGSL